MLVIVLIYVCVRYLQTLLPEQTKLLALVGLLVTILYVVGAIGAPAFRGGL